MILIGHCSPFRLAQAAKYTHYPTNDGYISGDNRGSCSGSPAVTGCGHLRGKNA